MSHGLTSKDSMFSVREVPWHGLGRVLEKAPTSIEEALELSGLGWQVKEGAVAVRQNGKWIEAPDFKANVRQDTGDVLGIVSNDYQQVQNRDAFRFLDALIGSQVHFETAGSLQSGKRVWVLARLPEFVELAGDPGATYIYVANSHDGSMAVTAAPSVIRIVCRNTFTAALSASDRSGRVFRFRHTGDLQLKYDEARQALKLSLDYEKQFKALADKMGRMKLTENALEKRVLRHLYTGPEDMGDRARRNRERTIQEVLSIFRGEGKDGDTTGNSPGTKWCGFNAICERQDWGRRVTQRTDQMQRSFEDQSIKQRALELVLAA